MPATRYVTGPPVVEPSRGPNSLSDRGTNRFWIVPTPNCSMLLGGLLFQRNGRTYNPIAQTSKFHGILIDVGRLTAGIEAFMIGPRRLCRVSQLVHAVAAFVFLIATAIADEPTSIEITAPLPYGRAPIDYHTESTDDAVAHLQRRLDARDFTFTATDRSGYLLELLKVLNVSTDSQLLVFSKTSVHQSIIGPKTPRAIYFNDDVTVGWVPGAPVIEIAVQDTQRGTVFYALPQPLEDNLSDEVSAELTTKFRRDTRCIACHISTRTLNVPGHIVGSFITAANGQPREGFSSISHSTDFAKRWGGWFVSGRAAGLVHLGNLIGPEDARRHQEDPAHRGVVDDLAPLVDLKHYPTPHSDVVALLVFDHQMQFYNLVNRVSFEHRLNRRSDAEERLVRYALMLDETPLAGPVTGATKFAERYQSLGSRDKQGRSLRELDLKTRLFNFNLSPLILSQSFQSLPDDVRLRLYRRIDEQLAQRPDATSREIVRELIADWPE